MEKYNANNNTLNHQIKIPVQKEQKADNTITNNKTTLLPLPIYKKQIPNV